jgi:single-stranded-DNA-specific exonuclease
MACGVRLRIENLEAFRQRFDDYVREHATAESLTPKIHIDAVARLANIDFKLCEEIKTMGPFGQGNRRPLLMIEDAVVRDPKTMGTDGKHLLFYATQGAGRFKCIAWNEGDAAHQIPTDTRVDLIVEPQISEWQGRNSMELLVRGIKLK